MTKYFASNNPAPKKLTPEKNQLSPSSRHPAFRSAAFRHAVAPLISELTLLMTLAPEEISEISKGNIAPYLFHAVDTVSHLYEDAQIAWEDGNNDQAAYYEQEASAWRHTSRILQNARQLWVATQLRAA